MARVPEGGFWMGNPDDLGAPHEHPRHKVWLDSFWIDKNETTVAEYRGFARATGRAMPEQPSWNLDSHPVVNVNWSDGRDYCSWAGKRLPTEAEWEKAARGTDERRFPWGHELPSAGGAYRANYSGYDAGDGFDRQTYLKDGFEQTSPVGSFPQGASPYGCLDMAGNVWEWVADWYDKDYYSRSPATNPRGPEAGTTRVLRGGSYSAPAVAARTASRDSTPPDDVFESWGFRCAASEAAR